MIRVFRWRKVFMTEQVRVVCGINLHVLGLAVEHLRWTGYNEVMLRVACLYLSVDWGSARHENRENLKEG